MRVWRVHATPSLPFCTMSSLSRMSRLSGFSGRPESGRKCYPKPPSETLLKCVYSGCMLPPCYPLAISMLPLCYPPRRRVDFSGWDLLVLAGSMAYVCFFLFEHCAVASVCTASVLRALNLSFKRSHQRFKPTLPLCTQSHLLLNRT